MFKVKKEELLRIANLSAFTLDENEVALLQEQLTKVLDYTTELNEVNEEVILEAKSKVNVFRDDKTVPYNSEDVLEAAPDRHEDYFVVPKIL